MELGLQTIHPSTAAYIRRGYDLACFDGCVRRLRAAGIEVIVHMILGLPFETPRMMYETASYVGKSGVQGVKLQLFASFCATRTWPKRILRVRSRL